MEETITYRQDSSCRLYHWGVDVHEGDTPICRGIIRNWIPRSGLIVDFLYPDHHEDLIPFQKIIGVPCHRRLDYTAGDAAETIVQRSSDQPWRWYPCRVLTTDSTRRACDRSYAFVEIDCSDGLVREVMAADRVRLPTCPELEECRRCREPVQVLTGIRALGKHMHQHAVEMPQDPALLAITKNEGFLRMWEREAGMTGAKFKEDRLVYVSYSRAPISEGEMKKCLRRICGLYQTLRAAGPGSSVSESKRLLTLPLELMGEVLSFLDVNDQIKCQHVCRAWYSFPKRRQVHVDLTKYSGVDHQKLVVTLLKTVTSVTRTLVLSGRNLQHHRGIRQAARMLKAMGSRMSTIILVQQDPVDEIEHLSDWLMRCCAAYAKITAALLWQQALPGSTSRIFRFTASDSVSGTWTEASISA